MPRFLPPFAVNNIFVTSMSALIDVTISHDAVIYVIITIALADFPAVVSVVIDVVVVDAPASAAAVTSLYIIEEVKQDLP